MLTLPQVRRYLKCREIQSFDVTYRRKQMKLTDREYQRLSASIQKDLMGRFVYEVVNEASV